VLAGAQDTPEVPALLGDRGDGEVLQAGRIRMMFVADRVPDELRRIVEFLNEQMTMPRCMPWR
jgi:hypothetical protein